MREHKADQSEHFSILVHQVTKFVSYNKSQFIVCHKVDQSGIDVHDMRFSLTCCCYCPCVDCRISCNIEIYRILESETSLDILEEVIKMAHEPLFNLEAMTFHCTSYAAASLAI